jgi:hypothetical protein
MKPRKISNRELAGLPEAWENPIVDTRHYIQCALEAWEVDRETYQEHKAEGGLCQVHNDKYYIA